MTRSAISVQVTRLFAAVKPLQKGIEMTTLQVKPCTWTRIGLAGPHKGHHLRANERYEVWCVTCDVVLSNEESDTAWPSNSERRSAKAIEIKRDADHIRARGVVRAMIRETEHKYMLHAKSIEDDKWLPSLYMDRGRVDALKVALRLLERKRTR